jgi:hypothetical protein
MLKISLKQLNDCIQPMGYTVAIVRDDKDDESGPYHSIWIGENDEFIYKSEKTDEKE